MVDYKCNRCGFFTIYKNNFRSHLNRKNICKPVISNTTIYDIKKQYNIENKLNDSHSTLNDSHLTPNDSENTNIDSQLTQNDSLFKNTISNNKYSCDYCGKILSKNSNLHRHLKICKEKKKSKEQNKITLLEKEKEELLKTVEKLLIECSNKSNNNTINSHNSNNSNNTNSNNTNNTIIINNYGDENTKYITKEYIVNLLANKPFKAIPEMIKYTHFNKEHPENQNIKITNKKEPYVKIMKDNKWEYQDRKNTITDLIDKQHIKISDENIEKKVEKHCSTTQKNNIIRCNDLYVNEDEDYLKRLYNESELVVINNS
jgi:hypothetical protein